MRLMDTTNAPRSIWWECKTARSRESHWRRQIAADPLLEIAAEFEWSEAMVGMRLRIARDITDEVVRLSGLSDAEMDALPLGRLLDAARRRTPRDRAICLACAARGRRPEWADRHDFT